MTLVGS
ncbi:hypothetical protein ZEAMMB73_Zm00001d040990 [Zea mays]|nr:hypothetical protein ZEAMMB73_Zm00001d040990 [Zea mays]